MLGRIRSVCGESVEISWRFQEIAETTAAFKMLCFYHGWSGCFCAPPKKEMFSWEVKREKKSRTLAASQEHYVFYANHALQDTSITLKNFPTPDKLFFLQFVVNKRQLKKTRTKLHCCFLPCQRFFFTKEKWEVKLFYKNNLRTAELKGNLWVI